MKNRIRHLLENWDSTLADAASEAEEQPPQNLPPGISMLVPVELCINRELLIALLSASIQEIYRHRRELPAGSGGRERIELEAALQQQLAFRVWAREHPSEYLRIAMYPVAEPNRADDLEDLEDFEES